MIPAWWLFPVDAARAGLHVAHRGHDRLHALDNRLEGMGRPPPEGVAGDVRVPAGRPGEQVEAHHPGRGDPPSSAVSKAARWAWTATSSRWVAAATSACSPAPITPPPVLVYMLVVASPRVTTVTQAPFLEKSVTRPNAAG